MNFHVCSVFLKQYFQFFVPFWAPPGGDDITVIESLEGFSLG